MKPWLVAHRGAPKEAQENTLAAFEAAKKYNVGYLELDVRVTKDNVAIIHHDPSIGRHEIAQTNFAELQAADPYLTQFEELITQHPEQPLFVELKSIASAKHTIQYLTDSSHSYATSFISDELHLLQNSGIAGNRLFLAQHKHAFGLQNKALRHAFGGVTVNKWYLTPLFYWRAHKKGLKILVYTVNSTFWAWVIRKLYPSVFICTDHPNTIGKLH